MNLPVLILCIFVCSRAYAKLPSNFNKCSRKQSDFDDCFFKAVEHAIKQLNVPIKEVGLPSIDPLFVPSMTIGAGTSAVAFEQRYTNLSFTGFTNIKFSKVGIDFKTNVLSVEGTVIPEVVMSFNYDFNGNVLMLPITGKGPGKTEIVKPKFSLEFNLEEYDKDGQKHLKVKGQKFHWEAELLKFNFENLFGGDKALSDNINKVMNENWQPVFEDVGSSYSEALGQIFAAIANEFFAKVSVLELFGEE